MKNQRNFTFRGNAAICLIASAFGVLLALPARADTESEVRALKTQLERQQVQIQMLLDAQEAQKALNQKAASAPAADPKAPASTSGYSFYGVGDISASVADSGKGNKLAFGSGGFYASRLGVKGQRDLGNGLSAVGVAEAGLFLDTGGVGNGSVIPGINNTNASSGAATTTGNQIFSRQIYAGLTSPQWGSLTFGRQYAGSYVIAVSGNVMGTSGYGYSAALTPLNGMPTRANNSAIYSTPNFNGFTGQVLYTTGSENNTNGVVPTAVGSVTSTNDKAGRGFDLSATYAKGPLYGGLSTWSIYNTTYTTGETDLAKKRGWQGALSYDFGILKLAGNYTSAKISGGNYENVTRTLSSSTGWSTSVSVPVGQGRVYVSYTDLDDKSSLNRDAKLYGILYGYDLFQNTKLYAGYGRLKNSATASYSLPDGGNLVGNITTPGTAAKGLVTGLAVTF